MPAVFVAFLHVCSLRLRPQDIPKSEALLALTLCTHAAASVAIELLLSGDLGSGIALALVDTILLVLMTGSLLGIQGHGQRTVQTLTALTGAGTILSFVAILIILVDGSINDQGSVPLLLLVIWHLIVVAHVLRHALSAAFYQGLIVACVFYWITFNVIRTLFPFENV